MLEKYLTTEQVADILQIHPFTVLKFLKNGRLVGVKIGRVYRIKESDVREFLEKMSTQKKTNKEQEKKTENFKKIEDEGHYYII